MEAVLARKHRMDGSESFKEAKAHWQYSGLFEGILIFDVEQP